MQLLNPETIYRTVLGRRGRVVCVPISIDSLWCCMLRVRVSARTRQYRDGEIGYLPTQCQPNLATLQNRGKRLQVYACSYSY